MPGDRYEALYQLREKPFAILPDPGYLYFGERHTLAYTVLEYGVVHGAGFTVITGEVGCGKTTLIRHLLDSIEQDVTVGLIFNTRQDIGELLKWVLLAFDQPYDANDKVALFDQLQRLLINEYAQGRRTVLIIDEAQNLGISTLEELRMLSHINADRDQLLQMVLVGQPQLKHLLSRPRKRLMCGFPVLPRRDQLGLATTKPPALYWRRCSSGKVASCFVWPDCDGLAFAKEIRICPCVFPASRRPTDFN